MRNFARKLTYGEGGNFAVEASLLFPVVMLCTIALLVISIYFYQKTSLYLQARTAAERTAFVWDNSGKNQLTGGVPPNVHDGLYWRLLDDRAESPLAQKKLSRASDLFAQGVGVRINYRNRLIERTVFVDLHKDFSVFAAVRAMWDKTEMETGAFSRVVDPVEFVRTVDLARTYFPLIKASLGNLRFRSLLSGRNDSADVPAAKAFPTEAEARKYLQKLVNGAEIDKTLIDGRKRKIDALDKEGIAHQAYLGYIPNRTYVFEGERINVQLEKDLLLLKEGKLKGVVWHFFQSEKTNKIGPSGPLLRELQKAGIIVVVHGISGGSATSSP